MYEKFIEVAEQSAMSASRRQFLEMLGRRALVVAAAIGGLMALPQDAEAAGGSRRCPPNCIKWRGNCYCPR